MNNVTISEFGTTFSPVHLVVLLLGLALLVGAAVLTVRAIVRWVRKVADR